MWPLGVTHSRYTPNRKGLFDGTTFNALWRHKAQCFQRIQFWLGTMPPQVVSTILHKRNPFPLVGQARRILQPEPKYPLGVPNNFFGTCPPQFGPFWPISPWPTWPPKNLMGSHVSPQPLWGDSKVDNQQLCPIQFFRPMVTANLGGPQPTETPKGPGPWTR